jgi:hypothetical protein
MLPELLQGLLRGPCRACSAALHNTSTSSSVQRLEKVLPHLRLV